MVYIPLNRIGYAFISLTLNFIHKYVFTCSSPQLELPSGGKPIFLIFVLLPYIKILRTERMLKIGLLNEQINETDYDSNAHQCGGKFSLCGHLLYHTLKIHM